MCSQPDSLPAREAYIGWENEHAGRLRRLLRSLYSTSRPLKAVDGEFIYCIADVQLCWSFHFHYYYCFIMCFSFCGVFIYVPFVLSTLLRFFPSSWYQLRVLVVVKERIQHPQSDRGTAAGLCRRGARDV